MLITLSIIGGLAGVTGAASLTKFFCETFGKGITLKPPGRFRLEHRDSVDIPEVLADDAQLIRGLLDDAEITLRGLRRERPGPSRSFKIIKLIESYHPELQQNSYQRKMLAPILAHVSDIVREKAGDLLREDLESGLSDVALDSMHVHSVTAA